MQIETITKRWRKARGANATDNQYPSRIDVLSQPAYVEATAAQAGNYAIHGLGVIKESGSGVPGPSNIVVRPYAIAADDSAFGMRVYGVSRIFAKSTSVVQWTWTMLCQIACTTSGAAGVSGGIVIASELYSDTNVQTYPAASVPTVIVHSNAADIPAHIVVDLLGFEGYEITFTTGGTSTSCNALVKEF